MEMAAPRRRAPGVLALTALGLGRRPQRQGTQRQPFCPAAAAGDEQAVKEWHFHVYFHLDEASVAQARRLRDDLVAAVRSGELTVVLNGVDRGVLPSLTAESEGKVPSFNDRPVGPHPEGSFEVWCPAEQLGAALAWLTVHRGACTVLLCAPLTPAPRPSLFPVPSGRALSLRFAAGIRSGATAQPVATSTTTPTTRCGSARPST